MNHKKSRVLAAAISSLLSFGMILQTAVPPQVYASEGIRRESSQKVSDWTFKAADNNDQTAVTEVVRSDAYLSGLEIKGGSLDKPFSREFSSYSVVVGHKTDSLTIIPKIDGNAAVTVNGKAAGSGQAVTVNVKTGSYVFNIVVKGANGKTETTAVNVLRNSDPDDVYSVPYRSQYHFSPQRAWCNDPNGMVYYKGEYHLFYQYYPDDMIWGPMHWGHAVSKDLVHWEELPIALYPESDGGAMFSGCCVVDKDNTTGFFGQGKEGLVAIYTQDNGDKGQEQCLAYSKDKGRTWTKYQGNPVLRWEDDRLLDKAFRDPKVFWHEESGQWMMVVAGGPLRIYSSKNLKSWKLESTYGKKTNEGIADQPADSARIYTECPDLYPLKVDNTDQTKWVLSEGGRYYRIGDLKQQNEHWTFVPDSDYSNTNDNISDPSSYKNDDTYKMNFGPQSYAAQTYSNMPDSRTVMINWASTWENGYCNNVSEVTGQYGFNGFFNLQNELTLKQIDGKVRLVQKPVKEYESLRMQQAKTELKNAVIPEKTDSSENLLSGFQGGEYEIIAEFTPKTGTREVGFKLRTGKNGKQETVVKYNVQDETLIINGDKAGVLPQGQIKGDIKSKISKSADGKIKLHIFVDDSIVEVYGNEGETVGSLAVFPDAKSTGAEVFSEGGQTEADITIYPLKSIWSDKMSGSTDPANVYLNTETASSSVKLGETTTLNSTVTPQKAEQKVSWSIAGNSGKKVSIVKQDAGSITLKGEKQGTVIVKAKTSNGIARTMEIQVDGEDEKLNSNLSGWHQVGGQWTLDANGYNSNHKDNGFLISSTKTGSDYIYEADVTYQEGNAIGLFFRGQSPDSDKGYVVNIDDPEHKGNGSTRIFTFGGGTGDIGSRVKYTLTPGATYHLKLEVRGNKFKFYINDSLKLNVTDRNIKKNYAEGDYVGLYAFSGTGESDKNIQASYQNIKVTPLEVRKPSVREKMELYSGQSIQLAADLGEDDYAAAYYESSDPSVASVDDDGKVTAKRSGTAELTTKVTYYGRTVYLKTKITVKTPYVNITSAPSSMYEGQSANISAKATGVSGNIVWKVDNASCASISSSGKLTAKKAGKVYITAKVGVYSTKKMIVIKRPYIKITSCPSSVYTGKSVQLKAQAVGVSGKVAWSVSRRSLASVSASGKLSAKKAGKITVTAKLKNYSKTVKVTIKKPYLKITSYRKTVKRRKSYRFRAKAYGTSKSVKWSLSSKSRKYASISKGGKLTTKSRKGTITVYIKSGCVRKTLKVKIK
ncbi:MULTISPECIES: GH32 C-terminal domain-containing protein [Anaerostipes]|uniref:GH32 C-terminal domain-containing protein n=1 Tax=Anaerostipes hominis (ex Liu et al. 2021) TaxID=2763018 RepID=A0ABR7FLM7_9FIRM|nr:MULTISPECIES: GH32 C-terminal domain-containing protein [Anaerostipes]MBC5676130.1 GH32 C-terminal domain-containing protein [Anaerostipes hominis (ex Liu et al. 2021)]